MATKAGWAVDRVRVKVPSRRRGGISRVAAMVDACVYLALLVVFNSFPHRVGFWVSATDSSSFVPILAPEFAAHMAYLNALWAFGLAVAVAKVIYGRWTPLLRFADLGVGLLTIYALFRMITGGPLIDPSVTWGAHIDLDWLPSGGGDVSSPEGAFKGLLALVAVLMLLGILQKLLAAVRQSPGEQKG